MMISSACAKKVVAVAISLSYLKPSDLFTSTDHSHPPLYPTPQYSPRPNNPPSSAPLLQNASNKPVPKCRPRQSQPKHLHPLRTLHSKTGSPFNPCTKARSANLGLKKSFSSTAPNFNDMVHY